MRIIRLPFFHDADRAMQTSGGVSLADAVKERERHSHQVKRGRARSLTDRRIASSCVFDIQHQKRIP